MADVQDVTEAITQTPMEAFKAEVLAMAVIVTEVSARLRNDAINRGPKLQADHHKKTTFDWSLKDIYRTQEH